MVVEISSCHTAPVAMLGLSCVKECHIQTDNMYVTGSGIPAVSIT